MRATKKATKIEIENLKKILQQNKEAAKVISEFRKQFKGFPTKTTDDIIKLFDDIKAEQATPNINPNTTVNVGTGNGGVFSGTWDKIRQTKPITYIIDKPVKSALYGLGVVGVGAAIYYMLDSKSGGQPYIALDENGNPIDPTEGSQLFPICVQELINSGEGQITKSSDGSSSVYYKEQNIYFYTNGRAYDATNKKNGTYKCRGTQFNENKSKKLSLYEIAISESSEIDLNTMTNYVDTAVDDLDGYVNVGNLNSLYSIVSALKGKTFQGKDALQQFMMLYSQEEGGDDFKDDVNSVGVRVLGTKGIVLKNQILDILSGGSGSSTTSTGEKIGLKNIDFFWDDKKIEGGGGGGGGTQPKYFDCSQKDFPYQYGCIAPKIAEIQTCLGVTPNKGYFGPKTKRELGYSVITKDLYYKIMAECGKGSTTNYDAIKQAVFKGSDEMIKKGKENVRNTYQNTVNNLSNNLYPTSEEFETIKNKLENYRELSDREKQIYNKYSEKFSGYPSAI